MSTTGTDGQLPPLVTPPRKRFKVSACRRRWDVRPFGGTLNDARDDEANVVVGVDSRRDTTQPPCVTDGERVAREDLPPGIFTPFDGVEDLQPVFHENLGWSTGFKQHTSIPKSKRNDYHSRSLPKTGPDSLRLINARADRPTPTEGYTVLPAKSVAGRWEAVYQRKDFVMEYCTVKDRKLEVSPVVNPDHHTSNHTDGFLTFPRKSTGVYMFGNSHQVVHSEVLTRDRPALVSKGIELGNKYVQVNQGVYNLGGYPFVLHNGEDPEGLIRSMELQKVFYDSCLIRKDDTWTIIKRGKRGNRAINLGRTSGRCLKVDSKTKVAEPVLIPGSQRYPRLWVVGSDLLTLLCEEAGCPRPMNDKKRNQRYSKLLHVLNDGIEHMSLLVEVHDDERMTDIMDLLMRHLDINNCHTPLYAYVVCAWETFFVDVIGRYVI